MYLILLPNDKNIHVAFARSMKAICKNYLEMVKKYVAISPINMTDYDSYGKYEIIDRL